MKKSKVVISVVAVLGAAWIGGAWFTGQTAETEYKRQIDLTNQRFKPLNVSDFFHVTFKNKQFERGLFSSQIEDEIVISLPQEQKQWTIPFSTKLYHGPLPLNQLAKFNLVPVMFSAEGAIAKNETTQPLFDVTKSDKPIQYQASTGYGLSTKGSVSLAAGEVSEQESNNKLTWSKMNVDFDVNKDLSGSSYLTADELSVNFVDDSKIRSSQNNSKSVQIQWKGIQSNSTFEPTKWAYIYTGKGTSSIESIVMNILDQQGVPFSFVEKGVKDELDVSLDGDFVSIKEARSTDSMMINDKSLGKVVYNFELNHIEGNALNALMDAFVNILKTVKDNNANAVNQILETWFAEHGKAIFDNQPQVKFNPISISDEQGKLSLDLNIALAQKPTFDLMRGNLYKQFKDFAVEVWLNKATAENLLAKFVPEQEKANLNAKIEEFAAEGANNGVVVNSEKSVSMKLVLESGELKLNGNVVPEEQVQGIIFMLLMSAAMPH
ncbi:YdgA family protein [Rodentibacter abscessus]|uniref:YdgA family protein n=1 Tax=Rodentibacter abscessus TaxID=3381777 RepID=UPI00399C973F